MFLNTKITYSVLIRSAQAAQVNIALNLSSLNKLYETWKVNFSELHFSHLWNGAGNSKFHDNKEINELLDVDQLV